MRPLRWSCQAPCGENSFDTLGTTTFVEPRDHFYSSGIPKIDATAEENVSTLRHESGGNATGGARASCGSGRSVGEYRHHRGVAEEGANHVYELDPDIPLSLAIVSKGLAPLSHDCPATSTGGRCQHRCTPVFFAQDLTHSEVDALLGPKLVWQNPFEV